MLARCLIAFCLLVVPRFTVAQQEERATEFSPLPKSIDSTKVLYKNKLLIFPIVALSTETSWVFGLANAYIFKTSKKDPGLRTSTMPSGLLYTLKDQILIALGANIFLPRERYIIRFESSFSRFPDKFWGLGNDTPDSAEEPYTFTQFYVNPAISRKVYKNLFVGLGLEYQNVYNIKYLAGGNFEKDQVVGIYNRNQYSVFGASALFTYDSRNHAYTPDHGALFRVKFSTFGAGSDYSFRSFDVDFRRYLQIYPNHVLAFQYYGLFTFGEVAYRNLAILGGNSMMRGYYAGRYRDKMFMGLQGEFRFPVYWRFGAVGFASAGQVADQFSTFNFKTIHYAVGGGIRFSVLPRENLNLRFDVAYGDKVNYYVVLSESF
jgi:outer membrane protein assembly factor BamA